MRSLTAAIAARKFLFPAQGGSPRYSFLLERWTSDLEMGRTISPPSIDEWLADNGDLTVAQYDSGSASKAGKQVTKTRGALRGTRGIPLQEKPHAQSLHY